MLGRERITVLQVVPSLLHPLLEQPGLGEACGTLRRLVCGGEARGATLALPPELRWTAYRGEEDPIRGWYSPGFGLRVPATALVGHGRGSASTSLVTRLTFG